MIMRLLIALFPRAFRHAFGGEMREVFDAQLRAARATGGRAAVCRLYARTTTGMIAAAWRERRATRTPRRGPLVEWTDLRHTLRRLAATPGFTFAVIGTLALCMAANLTIFAAVHSILLRPLPFPDAGRLVTIYNTYPRANVMDDGSSIANYYERRGGRVAAFTSVSLYRDDAVIVGETGSTEREFVMRVSPEFFSTLGVRLALGRTFHDGETAFGSDRVAILSEPYWRQQYASDPAAVGRSIRVNGTPFTVVGVLPAGFRFLSSRARIFLPLASGADDRESSRRHSGSSSRMVARLAPGVTADAAQSQLDAHDAVMERDDPQAAMMKDAGYRSLVVGLHARHVESARPALLLLQAGAGTLLLIGLVNVANLFLVRAGSRTRELAVRRAIGARASHIAGAVLTETLVLSAAGTAAGLAIAVAGVTLLGRLGAARLPLGTQIALDGTSLLAAAAAAIAIGVVLGAAIALHHLRNDAGDALRSQARGGTAGPRAQRTRHVILVAQIALSFVLLSSAALLASGVRSLTRVAPGFRADALLTAQVSLPWARYQTDAALQSFLDRLQAGLARVPGFTATGMSTNIPLSGSTIKSAATVADRPRRPGELPIAAYSYAIAGDYFGAMRIPLLEGRYLAASDVGAAARACVIDDAFARRVWPSGGAVGQRLFLGGTAGAPEEAYTVVGVVGAAKQASLSEPAGAGAVYYPYSERFDRAIYIVGRTSVPPETLIPDLRRIVRQIDPELPINNARSMATRVDDSLVAQRSPAAIGVLFSAVALLLTALGTYGVLSYAVSQRRREIGVRIALGARPRQVRGQFLRVGARLLAWGLALGVFGSWAGVRALRTLLSGVPQAPAAAIAAASIVMAAVCVAACLLPARRAARISPMDAIGRDAG
jgi:predicted permease